MMSDIIITYSLLEFGNVHFYEQSFGYGSCGAIRD